MYLRYGPTFLGKMFLKFSDKRIKIIDSKYLIWNHTHSQTKQNINYMIQVNLTLHNVYLSNILTFFSSQMINLGPVKKK